MNVDVLGLALLAGAVAAVNPCGIALLPAYLGLFVGSENTRAGNARQAVTFAGGMTLGFVAVFGIAGAVLAPLALSIEPYLPYVTVVIGVVLLAVGVWLLSGRQLGVRGLAGRGWAPSTSVWSKAGYGVSFALASLSCTIAPFLAVTAGALRSGGLGGVVGAFLVYALGMGIVVLVLALAVAGAKTSVVGSMRKAGVWIGRATGILLVIAGAYVAWYGWFEIRVLTGRATSDPIVSRVIAVQSAVSRWLQNLGAGGLLVIGVVLIVTVGALIIRRRVRT